nr:hypothetical protein [Tanacetum cinerariifolium]
TKDLYTADYTQLYNFRKYNQKEVDELKAERLAKTQDPLALMANSNNPYDFLAPHQDQSSLNQNYLQQPMPNPDDITDLTTVMNMALALMAKAFKLNYSTPTNNNQRISSNLKYRQIAQPGMNMGQDRQMQMVGGNGGNQFRQYTGQNAGNPARYNDVIGNQPEWSLHVTIVHQTKDLHTADYTQLYDFLKYNQKERISSNPCNRQIAQPGMNMGQDRQMQMIGGNAGNQFRQYVGQNAGNLNGYNAVQNVENQNQIGNGNLMAVRAEGNAVGHNRNQIRCYNCKGVGHFARDYTVRPRRMDAAYLQTQLLIAQKEEAEIQLQAEEYDLMVAGADLDEIKEVNANCILMANLQQASSSGTQTDSAPVYDSDGSAEYTELLEPIPEPQQVPQNNNNVISEVTDMEPDGETVEQHSTNLEETHALYESLYQNIAVEFEKVNSVNRKLKETNADLTTELARYKNQKRCFEISQEKYDKL